MIFKNSALKALPKGRVFFLSLYHSAADVNFEFLTNVKASGNSVEVKNGVYFIRIRHENKMDYLR